jgi:glycosyltransferase involved in cell wall biosynthesis
MSVCESLAEPGVEVLGWVDRDRLSRLYRRARAVVLASRWQEPFGIVGLEAAAFGVPVVAWDSGGIRDWHPRPLVAWGDVDGLACALREVVARPPAVVRSPAAFDRGPLMRRLVAIYEQIREPAAPLVRKDT